MRKLAAATSLLVLVGAAGEARAECWNLRPTDATGYLGYVYDVAEKSFASPEGNVRVHWVESGTHAPNLKSSRTDAVPDAVVDVATVAEEAIAHYAKLGFRPVLRDGDYGACSSNGGDDRLDFYLVRFGAGDGVTVPEKCVGGATKQCAGFLLVDSRLAYYKTHLIGARTVAAHELFHLVQNAYTATMDHWFAEGTAQWAVKDLYPDLVDLEANLPAFFSQVERPIDAPPAGAAAGYLYGSAIWPVFLGETQGKPVFLDIFAEEAKGAVALDATDTALVSRKTTLADAFTTFATWNAGTGSRAGTGGYAKAAVYPEVPTHPFPDGVDVQVDGVTAGFASRYFVLADPGTRLLSLEADGTRLGAVALPLEGGKARVDLAALLPAEVTGDVMVVLAGRSSKKTDVPYVLRATAPTPPPAPPVAESKGGCAFGGGTSGEAWIVLSFATLLVRRRRSRKDA